MGVDGLVLVQMSGVPGAGKSTVARGVGRCLGFAVLDHDVVLTALLDAGVSIGQAGKASYETVRALADDSLGMGRSVIIDSPCRYDEILVVGQAIAERHQASYRYIECVADDIPLLDRRLRGRQTMRSQRPSVAAPPRDAPDQDIDGTPMFRNATHETKRPATGYLRLDTTRPAETCVRDAIDYIKDGRGS